MSRCDVTDSASRPIIAEQRDPQPGVGERHQRRAADRPARPQLPRRGTASGSARDIGATSSIVKFSIAPGNTSSRNARDLLGVEPQLGSALKRSSAGPPVPSAACAAASRAIGTRNGEHDT